MLTFPKSPVPHVVKRVASPSRWLYSSPTSFDSRSPSFATLMDGIQMQSALRLNDLPLEMLITILEESEWRDVLQLRKVRFNTSMWHVSKVFTPPDLHGAVRSLENSEHLVEPLSRLPCSIYYISPA